MEFIRKTNSDGNTTPTHPQLPHWSRSRMRNRAELRKAATARGVNLRLADAPGLTRTRQNRSKVFRRDANGKGIFWSVEFKLVPIPTSGCANHPSTGDADFSKLNAVCLLVHDCEERTRLMSIWNDRVVDLPLEKQDDLVIVDRSAALEADSPLPFGVLNAWLQSPIETASTVKYFFYVLPNHRLLTEVFPTNRLSSIVATPDLIVNEYPVIWVSRTELK